MNIVKMIVSYVIGITFSVVVMAFTVYYIYTFTLKSYDTGKAFAEQYTAEKPYKEVEINIAPNASLDEVADILYKEGIITNTLLFKTENILKNTDEAFEGGTFTVSTKMDSNQLNNALRKKIVVSTDIRITITEGYTVRDIAEYLEGMEIVSAEEFLKACNTIDFSTDYQFLNNVPKRENRLEGYLFPDTYMIAKNSTPETIIHKFLSRFEEIYTTEYAEKAEEMGLTMDEVVTIASMIEKEINREEERVLASAVIRNRMDVGMNLQMCSTILYVLDKRKDRLLDEDLQVQSPYNTYINAGLPVGPIANPGEACIKAALNPSSSDVLYFVVKDEETGEHIFTNNYDNFVDAKTLYKQKY